MMKRFTAYIRTGNFLLTVLSFFVSAFFVVMLAYIGRSYTVSSMSSGGFGSDSAVISVTGEQPDIQAIAAEYPVGIFREFDSKDYTVYFVTASPHYSYRYSTGLPAEGCAVTGYGFTDKAFTLSLDKDYTYKVTGKIGYRGVSALNWSVFINQTDISPSSLDSAGYTDTVVYTVDGNKKAVSSACAAIVSQCGEIGSTAEVLEYGSGGSIGKTLQSNSFLITVFILFMLCVTVTCIIFAVFWLQKQKQEVYVRRFLGFGSGKIMKSVLKSYLLASDSGFAAAVVLLVPVLTVSGVMLSLSGSLTVIVIALLFINLFSVLSVVYPLMSFFGKKDINIYLK